MNQLRFPLALTLLLLLLPSSACFSSTSERATERIQQMQAKDFFDDPVQIALADAAEKGDLSRMQQAIERGADVDHTGREGMVPLYWALLKRNVAGFKYLLEQGANPQTVTRLPEGFQDAEASVMELAVTDPDPAYLKALLEHGADPNTIYNTEWNIPVIYRAIMTRRIKNVEVLLEHGADINYQDKSLETPLMQAVKARQFEIALFLLSAGADPTIEDNLGGSPVDIVKQFGARGVIKGSNDDAAYDQFVDELRKRGFLQ